MTNRPTCATCVAIEIRQPMSGDPPEAKDVGYCRAEPPRMVGDNPNTSYFPPVSLSRTWCRQWKPKEESRQ